jgi:hypothetical protein
MKDMSDVFDPEPQQWGLRGDPLVWRALREQLSGTYLPPSAGEVESMLYAAFNRLVAVDLATEMESSVYRAEFAYDGGGMSNGYVSMEIWRAVLLPLLVERALGML